MRRMFSEKQIKTICEKIAEFKISNAKILVGQLNIPQDENYDNGLVFFTSGECNLFGIDETEAGKVFGVNEYGEVDLLEVQSGGGTQLYKHEFTFGDGSHDYVLTIISTFANDMQIDTEAILYGILHNSCVSAKLTIDFLERYNFEYLTINEENPVLTDCHFANSKTLPLLSSWQDASYTKTAF